MTTIRAGALLAPFLLCGLAPQDDQPSQSASSASYVIECEVWTASDPGLVRKIEAQTASEVEAVLSTLKGAEGGTQRLARMLSPVDVGSQVRIESSLESPTTMITMSGGGKTQQNFSGYTSEQTTVVLGCAPGPAKNLVTTTLDLQITANQAGPSGKSNPAIPPPRRSVELQCSGTSASGELRMLQFQTSDPGMLVVFVRATAL